MKKKDNQFHRKLDRVNSRYPFRNWQNENGSITFSVPLEVPEDETVSIPVEAEEDRTYTMLRFNNGKPMRVHFVEITDEEGAFAQRKWLNALHKREWKYNQRYVLQRAYTTEGPVSSVWDRSPQMLREDEGYTVAEFSDLPDRIAAYIRKQRPDNDLYHLVYSLNVKGYTSAEITEKLRLEPGMFYFYKNKAYRLAQEYRKLFFDEGQYVFPRPQPRCRKKKTPEAEDFTIKSDYDTDDQGYVDDNSANLEEDEDNDSDKGYDLISEPDYDADNED